MTDRLANVYLKDPTSTRTNTRTFRAVYSNPNDPSRAPGYASAQRPEHSTISGFICIVVVRYLRLKAPREPDVRA